MNSKKKKRKETKNVFIQTSTTSTEVCYGSGLGGIFLQTWVIMNYMNNKKKIVGNKVRKGEILPAEWKHYREKLTTVLGRNFSLPTPQTNMNEKDCINCFSGRKISFITPPKWRQILRDERPRIKVLRKKVQRSVTESIRKTRNRKNWKASVKKETESTGRQSRKAKKRKSNEENEESARPKKKRKTK